MEMFNACCFLPNDAKTGIPPTLTKITILACHPKSFIESSDREKHVPGTQPIVTGKEDAVVNIAIVIFIHHIKDQLIHCGTGIIQ